MKKKNKNGKMSEIETKVERKKERKRCEKLEKF